LTNRAPDTLKNLVCIFVGLVLSFMLQTMMLVAVPLWAIDLGASASAVGIILSVPYLLPLIFAIPLGGLVTRFGSQKIVFLSSLGMAMSPWIIILFNGYAGLVLGQLIVGVSHLLFMIASQSAMASLAQGRTLEKYVGWYTMCVSGGQLLGPLMAGWLIDHNGIGVTFGIMGFIPIISLLSALFLTGEMKQGKHVEKSLSGYQAQVRLLKTNFGVQTSMVLTIGVMFALGAHASFLPVYLGSISMPATQIGLLVSLRAFTALLIRPFMPQLISLFGGRSKACILSMVFVALGLIWTGATSDFFLLAFFAVLIGIGSGVSQPLSMVVLAENVSAEQRPGALGMRLMGNRAALFLAPLLLGFLVELAGFKITFIIAGLLLSLFVFVLLRLSSERKRVQIEKT